MKKFLQNSFAFLNKLEKTKITLQKVEKITSFLHKIVIFLLVVLLVVAFFVIGLSWIF